VACNMPSLPILPLQITLSLSLTWLASMSLTVLPPCSWLTHFVEASYWTVISAGELNLRTVSVDLSGLLLMTVPSQRASFTAFVFAGVSWANIATEIGSASTDANNRVSSPFVKVISSSKIFSAVKNNRPRPSRDQVGRQNRWCGAKSRFIIVGLMRDNQDKRSEDDKVALPLTHRELFIVMHVPSHRL